MSERQAYPEGREPPPEHHAFISEIVSVFERYPEAAKRYTIADFGEVRDRSRVEWITDCWDWDGVEICDMRPRPE